MKRGYILLAVLLACLANYVAFAQQRYLRDSLGVVLKQAKTDTAVIKAYHQLYTLTDTLKYAESEMELSAKLRDKNWYAQSLLDVGRYYYFFTDSHDSALSYLKRSVQLAESLGNQMVLANGYRYLGFVFRSVDAFMAEAYYEKSLLICKKMHNDLLASYDYSAMGNIYEGIPSQYNKNTALQYYLQSLAIREKYGSYEEIASSLLETSRIYTLLGNYNKAFELRERGLNLAENAGDVMNIVSFCNLIGNDYFKLFHNDKKALEYEFKAYKMAKTQKNNFDILADVTRTLGEIYNDLKDYQKADNYYILYGSYNDSLRVKSNNEVYNLSGAKHELEVELERQKTIASNAEISKQKVKTERQTILRNTFLIGFGILLVFAIILYLGYRRQNITNRELTLSNRKIEIAYQLIESRNKDITDSIKYASTLQKAVLVSKEKVREKLKDAFILTLPKDIVSGDFYFYAEENEKVIIAACDCTGHGVPGALVSIVCSNALTRTIKEFHITEPAKILSKTREFVLETFGKAEGKVHDGMDVSLCSLNLKTREIEWSGAYNPLWYVHKNELHEIQADKQPIGIQENTKEFTNHTIKLEEGDTIYLFTDGFGDQFGGPKGKKFTRQQFQDLLLSIQDKSMADQQMELFRKHREWKGRGQQVDDILVIGIKV